MANFHYFFVRPKTENPTDLFNQLIMRLKEVNGLYVEAVKNIGFTDKGQVVKFDVSLLERNLYADLRLTHINSGILPSG